MPGVAEDQNFLEIFVPNKVKTLEKGHPFCFVVGSRTQSPSESMFHLSSGINKDPTRTCHP